MNFKTSDGLELFFECSGTGTPCIYLHGGPGYWSKSFQYYSQKYLEGNLEMIYLDQRGCGRSEHSPTQDYSLTRLIADIEELRIFLEITEWFVLGHSFGGILAVNYAYQYPDRTKGIILSNATLNMFDSFQHQIKKGSNILGIKIDELSINNRKLFLDSYFSIVSKLIERNEYFKFQFIDLAKKEVVDLIDQDGLNSDQNFQRNVFSSDEYFQDFTLMTNQIQKPVLIITGEYDNAVGPDHYRLFKFKNAEIQVLKSGHHPYIENQSEFEKALLDFAGKLNLLGARAGGSK